MLKTIIIMQNRKNFKEKLLNKTNASAKRTTIIFEKEEREFIDFLIKEGKEAGIKPLISKMLEIYKKMMIYDWRFPGEYYIGISRIALINIELLHNLVRGIPKEKWCEIGRKMGAILRVSIETTFNQQIEKRENWQEVFYKLKIQGLGDFYLRDKYILIKSPFITESELMMGLLEGLLGITLDSKTLTPPFVFEIKETLTGD